MFILLIFSISKYLTNVNPPIFILLDSPIIGRVTATAWRQLLRAHNSPSPHER